MLVFVFVSVCLFTSVSVGLVSPSLYRSDLWFVPPHAPLWEEAPGGIITAEAGIVE